MPLSYVSSFTTSSLARAGVPFRGTLFSQHGAATNDQALSTRDYASTVPGQRCVTLDSDCKFFQCAQENITDRPELALRKLSLTLSRLTLIQELLGWRDDTFVSRAHWVAPLSDARVLLQRLLCSW